MREEREGEEEEEEGVRDYSFLDGSRFVEGSRYVSK